MIREMRDLKKENQEQARKIESFSTQMRGLKKENEEQARQIKSLGTRGSWCGYQDLWNKVGTITYDRLIFSTSKNMEIRGTPLDITTGI